MSSVFQQIITDKINATPGGEGLYKITRDDANCGIFVTALAGTHQANRNTDAFASIVVKKVSLGGNIDTADMPFGVLGDYHNERQCSIIRKGRVVVAARYKFNPSDIGKYVRLDPQTGTATNQTAGVPKADIATTLGIGQILGGGEHEKIGHYYIVDLNLPHKGYYE